MRSVSQSWIHGCVNKYFLILKILLQLFSFFKFYCELSWTVKNNHPFYLLSTRFTKPNTHHLNNNCKSMAGVISRYYCCIDRDVREIHSLCRRKNIVFIEVAMSSSQALNHICACVFVCTLTINPLNAF